MRVLSGLSLLVVVAVAVAAPSDPAVLVPQVSPTAHSVSGVSTTVSSVEDKNKPVFGGSRHTILGSEDYSVGASPDHSAFGSRPTRTATEESPRPIAGLTTSTIRPLRTTQRSGIPIPHVLREGPSALAQVGHPSLSARNSGEDAEDTTERDEEGHESSETDDNKRHPLVLQASRSRSLRNFDFRPITFPLHDPPSFQPAPLSAAYTWNKVDQDAEEVSVGGEGHPAPDLSRDTAVNFFPPDRQGMVMVEPDAEVFDLNSVVEKSNDLEFS